MCVCVCVFVYVCIILHAYSVFKTGGKYLKKKQVESSLDFITEFLLLSLSGSDQPCS